MYYRTKVYINAELLATGSSTNEQESNTIRDKRLHSKERFDL